MFRTILASVALISCGLTINTHAAVLTYDLPNSNFSSSDWNPDGSNAQRAPGGEISGSFTVDTTSGTLEGINIDTAFYSLYGPQVLDSQYRYAVAGETDDRIGTQTVTIGATHIAGFSTNIGLTVDLTGTANITIGGNTHTGSIIQVLDQIGASTRIYYPRLTLFFEGQDLTSGSNPLTMIASESVWNINRGTGRAGYSGSQAWTGELIVTSDQVTSGGQSASVSVPGGMALLLIGLVGLGLRRSQTALNPTGSPSLRDG